MNRNDCDIARDLMPLSVDGVCSEGSQRFLDGHVAECQPCRDVFAQMKAGMPTLQAEPTNDAQALKKGLRWLGRRFKALWITLIALVSAFVLVLTAAGINQLAWNWTSTAPLDTYTVTFYRNDALFCLGMSATFPKEAYNGYSCTYDIVTNESNPTDGEKAYIITFKLNYLPNRAKEYMSAMATDEPVVGFVSLTDAQQVSATIDHRYFADLHSYDMCVENGKLYMIDTKQALTTTYGRPMMLLNPGTPVCEIRVTDGKEIRTVYTWGDEIPNYSTERVDDCGIPESGFLSPTDLDSYGDLIIKIDTAVPDPNAGKSS